MKLFFRIAQILFFCLFFDTAFAQRIGHSNESWKTIRTEHFDIVVNARQLDLGRYYAIAAERAYANLSGVFESMTERIVVIVNDTTDVSNGYATRIPYPHIMAFSVMIGDHDSLSEAGDWPRILLTHELTHVIQFEPSGGFYSWIRPIFGNIIAPNMLLPSWWKEGMAVELETHFSSTGRSRSIFQNATMRSIVLENKLDLYDLPQANETLPSWPYGTRPYIFGSLFFSQLVNDTQDIKSVNHLARRHGERLPYLIEQPMRELSGLSYVETYNKALFQVEENTRKEMNELRLKTQSEIQILDRSTQFSYRPTISKQQKLLAFLETKEDVTQLVVADFTGKKLDLKKAPKGSFSGLDFHPYEKKILYSKYEQVDSEYKFSDVYEYDIETGVSTQLTFSGRARNARYSPKGDRAVFVTTEGGLTQLRTLDITTKDVQFITKSTFSSRYESPIFWDDSTLLSTRIDADGRHSLVKVDLGLKIETTLPLNFKGIRFLRKINNSLYFVSHENGVNNIYVSKDLSSAVPVTHVHTGIWSYDIDSENNLAWTSLMTAEGFKIAQVKLFEHSEPLPKITNEIAARYTFKETEIPAPALKETDYEAGPYLWPSYWIPFISTSSSSKGIYLQAQTSGHDPINLHQYAVVFSYDSELSKGNFNGVYTNSTQEIPFVVSSRLRSFALGSYRDIVETGVHGVGLRPDVFKWNKNLGLEFGVQLQNTFYTTSSQHWGPYVQLAYKDYSQNLFEVSPESGWGGSLRLESHNKLYDETTFIARNYEKALFSVLGFWSDWLPAHHAIKARLSGHLTFENVFARYGTNSSTSFFEEDGVSPQFVMRGYSPAQFYGRNMWNINLEYRFPVSDIERGSGTDAYFFRRVTGAFVTDGLGVDGFGMSENLVLTGLTANESIWSSGVELKLESTIGYILPMNFVLGYYLPYSPLYASGSQIGLSLQIGGL